MHIILLSFSNSNSLFLPSNNFKCSVEEMSSGVYTYTFCRYCMLNKPCTLKRYEMSSFSLLYKSVGAYFKHVARTYHMKGWFKYVLLLTTKMKNSNKKKLLPTCKSGTSSERWSKLRAWVRTSARLSQQRRAMPWRTGHQAVSHSSPSQLAPPSAAQAYGK